MPPTLSFTMIKYIFFIFFPLLLGSYFWLDKSNTHSSPLEDNDSLLKTISKKRAKTNINANTKNVPIKSQKTLPPKKNIKTPVHIDDLRQKHRDNFRWSRGGIIGKRTHAKNIALIFSGHNYYYGMDNILTTLKRKQIKAGFFFTGLIFNKRNGIRYIKRLVREGHYLGPHSHSHIMYHPWGASYVRISRRHFRKDLRANIQDIQKYFNMDNKLKIFLPPYETYNKTISSWSRQMGYQIISYTPHSLTHKDWISRHSRRYISSARLLRHVLRRGQQNQLKGAILLIHTGISKKTRRKPFYKFLPNLISHLEKMGYQFIRIDRFLAP